MTLLTFGKHKNEMLELTPDTYIKWLAAHKNVLSVEHRYTSDVAKEILEHRAQVVAQAQVEGNNNWDEWEQSLVELQARHEKEMAVKIAEHLVSTPARVNLGLKGHLYGNCGFQLLR